MFLYCIVCFFVFSIVLPYCAIWFYDYYYYYYYYLLLLLLLLSFLVARHHITCYNILVQRTISITSLLKQETVTTAIHKYIDRKVTQPTYTKMTQQKYFYKQSSFQTGSIYAFILSDFFNHQKVSLRGAYSCIAFLETDYFLLPCMEFCFSCLLLRLWLFYKS